MEYFTVLYAVSQLLDAVDGVAARAFDQCSSFGSLLDMLTDRMTSLCLMLLLGDLYPSYQSFWRWMVVLDLVSHWSQMYISLSEGEKSHKGGRNGILQFYYSFPVLLISCIGNETFFIVSYILTHTKGPQLPLEISINTFLLKSESVSLLESIAICVFPIFVFKQITNVIQLQDACSRLAALDVKVKKLQ